jgi:hypothetical protein
MVQMLGTNEIILFHLVLSAGLHGITFAAEGNPKEP